jgi:hypothetical protein
MKGIAKATWILAWLVAAAWAGWKWGPALFPQVESWIEARSADRPGSSGLGAEGLAAEGPAPSAELAEQVLLRLDALRTGSLSEDRLLLNGVEVTSVLRFAMPGVLPPGVTEPTARFSDGRLRLTARVATAAFPDFPLVAEEIGVLPDRIDMSINGALLPFEPGWTALQVDGVSASRIPLPGRFIAPVLEALGRRPREGLPPRALAIPLPAELDRVWVEGDRLVIVRRR